ncbi:ABC transporter permease [Desulfatitalea alkaliphila]|uniref:ABC transporter permease n=1 Tax=Desulfatitalea alkaliphila TaxID=2929485 RepID=A0AA41RBM9_9BACT|nr:ABC transporter permease [Desulfatitalea alkaliphila]MCJ8502163.1 ABC transporter permease [Desulfatitalea alkaliphila]
MEILIESLPRFIGATWLTLQITALSVFIGFCMALPLSVLRVSRSPLLSWPVYAFTFYFRGTPLLVQIFLIYYGSGQFVAQLEAVGLWYFFQNPWFCAVLALTLNTAAYSTEIFRGGIQGVPFGEIEAARACGMSGALLYRRIILPRALRVVWPAYTNEVIFLLQASSLVSIITVMDITGVAGEIATRSFAFYEVYLFAAALYIVIVYGVLWVFRRIESRLNTHLQAEAL